MSWEDVTAQVAALGGPRTSAGTKLAPTEGMQIVLETRMEPGTGRLAEFHDGRWRSVAKSPSQPLWARCSILLGQQGKPMPRTCEACGLGPCVQVKGNGKPAPAAIPSFDDWYMAKHGVSFESQHECAGQRMDSSMKALSRALRDYTTDMVRARP